MQPLRYERQANSIRVACSRAEDTTIGIGCEAATEALKLALTRNGNGPSDRAVVVADSTAWRLHGAAFSNILHSLGFSHFLIEIESGEKSKSVEGLVEIWRGLQAANTKRRTLLIAFGGGVVSDMAGFAAATFMRGIPYIVVPTTLVAQIDASIGGKVAVDTPAAKNSLGCFYHPVAVAIWPSYLSTLAAEELASGMAEIIKVAVLSSTEMFEQIEELGALRPETVTRITDQHLRTWIQAKLDFLSVDPYEVGSLDRALNFGHSFGHAIESVHRYDSFRHGEAVAIGMAMACRIAVLRGLLDENISNKIIGCLRRNALPTELDPSTSDEVWRSLEIIRNIRDGVLREVLPTGFGAYVFANDISISEFNASCREGAPQTSAI